MQADVAAVDDAVLELESHLAVGLRQPVQWDSLEGGKAAADLHQVQALVCAATVSIMLSLPCHHLPKKLDPTHVYPVRQKSPKLGGNRP